ncbi:MAG: ABC transporter substrate-binding protein [Synergistaceae bacterium]|jgi:iron complex transport system substrate-binding protein|nr:ABC transporter substrate-binding protein [Synergistaceae bacterium]
MKKSTNKPLCLLLALLIVLSLSVSVCQAATTGQAAEAAKITVTDQAGREVTINGLPDRIVSGYYISSSTCIALGLTDRMVGIEAKADIRPIYALAAQKLLKLPNVGTAKEFNLEACVALEPDLVILPKRLRDSADMLAELGIPAILVNPENHRDLVEMITLIGRSTGAEDKAAMLVGYYNGELAAVAELTKGISERPSVYMAGYSGYLSTAPKDMYQASLIDAAGGVNAARGVDGDNWTSVSYEQVIAMNPDVIVIPAEASYAKGDILKDAQLADIAAVKEGKIYKMPNDFEAWDMPVPSCTLGIRWMLNALHGDVYPLKALQGDAASFYSKFYGVEIDAALIGK